MIRNYVHYWPALISLSETVDLAPLLRTFGMPSNASLEAVVWKYTLKQDGEYHNHVFRVWNGQYLVSRSTGIWAWDGKVQENVNFEVFYGRMLFRAKEGWEKLRWPTRDALVCLDMHLKILKEREARR